MSTAIIFVFHFTCTTMLISMPIGNITPMELRQLIYLNFLKKLSRKMVSSTINFHPGWEDKRMQRDKIRL